MTAAGQFPITHGTHRGFIRCAAANGRACVACTTAKCDDERARGFLRGDRRAAYVPMEALAAILTTPAGVVLVDVLGPQSCGAIPAAADRHGDPEYRRLRDVGVNPQSAALLAQYHQEVG